MGLLDAKASASAARKPVVPPHSARPPASALPQAAPKPSPPPVNTAPAPQQSREDEPDPARVGVVRFAEGEPFVHYCVVCGAWGAFGCDMDILTGRTGRWYCRDHRPQA